MVEIRSCRSASGRLWRREGMRRGLGRLSSRAPENAGESLSARSAGQSSRAGGPNPMVPIAFLLAWLFWGLDSRSAGSTPFIIGYVLAIPLTWWLFREKQRD